MLGNFACLWPSCERDSLALAQRVIGKGCAKTPGCLAGRALLIEIEPKQVRLEDELSKKVAKFEKRLSETDPVSGAPRYGESMTAKASMPALVRQIGSHARDLAVAFPDLFTLAHVRG